MNGPLIGLILVAHLTTLRVARRHRAALAFRAKSHTWMTRKAAA